MTEQDKLLEIEQSIKKAQDEANQIQQGVSDLAKEKQGDTSVESLNDTGDFNLQDPTVEQPDMSIANGFLEEQKAKEQAELEKQQKALADAQAQADIDAAENKKWWQAQQTPSEKAEETWGELGVSPEEYIAQMTADNAYLTGLWKSYNDKVAERDATIAQMTSRTGGTIDYMNAEVKRVTNAYNVELNRMSANINTKNAEMSMKQGLMNQARSFVNDAVANYTYEYQIAYEQYEQFEEENRELLNDLGQDIQDTLAEQKNINYNIWQEKKAEKDQVGNMMINNPQAGITLDDTQDEAMNKLNEWQVSQPTAGQGLYTETKGGFEILRDSAGNIVSSRVAGTEGAGAGTGEGNGIILTPDEMKIDIDTSINEIRGENPNVTNQEIYDHLSNLINMDSSYPNKQEALDLLAKQLGIQDKTQPEPTGILKDLKSGWGKFVGGLKATPGVQKYGQITPVDLWKAVKEAPANIKWLFE